MLGEPFFSHCRILSKEAHAAFPRGGLPRDSGINRVRLAWRGICSRCPMRGFVPSLSNMTSGCCLLPNWSARHP